MGFDIESIKSKKLKDYALKLDAGDYEGGIKNNKKLEGKELSIFLENSVQEMKKINDEEGIKEAESLVGFFASIGSTLNCGEINIISKLEKDIAGIGSTLNVGEIGSDSKLVQRHDEVMKRREELKNIAEDEIQKELKKDTLKSLSEYLNSHKNEDGTYDLSELSIVAQKYLGNDLLLNISEDESVVSEAEYIRMAYSKIDGVDTDNFDKEFANYKQTLDLIKFCGYKIGK